MVSYYGPHVTFKNTAFILPFYSFHSQITKFMDGTPCVKIMIINREVVQVNHGSDLKFTNKVFWVLIQSKPLLMLILWEYYVEITMRLIFLIYIFQNNHPYCRCFCWRVTITWSTNTWSMGSQYLSRETASCGHQWKSSCLQCHQEWSLICVIFCTNQKYQTLVGQKGTAQFSGTNMIKLTAVLTLIVPAITDI